jgi:hypothetical protein
MASEKTCFKCSTLKPLTDFYPHPQMGDGHLNKCKACAKRDVAEHRAANIDAIREYDRQRGSLPHRIELRKRVWERWAAQHPERLLAQRAVNNAVRDGRLQPLPCWVCNASAEAHHPDYSSPLDVVWLCRIHHRQAHWAAYEREDQAA